jgi:putative redox protein
MPSAKMINIKGVTFMGKSDSNHWVATDGSEMFGGSKAANTAKELLLISLGGCTGADVNSLLTKMRVPFTRFEIDLDAKMSDEHPKIYTRIDVTYKFWGEDLDTSKIERAIELSETKYCGVSAMLKNTVDIHTHYVVNPEE